MKEDVLAFEEDDLILEEDILILEEAVKSETSDYMDIFLSCLSELLLAKSLNVPIERIQQILKKSEARTEEDSLEDYIGDVNVPAEAALNAAALKERWDGVSGILTKREIEFLRSRFGMRDGKARTLEELAEELELTPEHVRQIELRALHKFLRFRYPSRRRKLREYLD